jgi:putative ABC transport system ATP-binding protein
VVSTHDERLVALADDVIELSPRPAVVPRPPAHRELAAGEVLFEQGDPGDLVYVVEWGQVDLVRALVDGREEMVAQRVGGEYFGELAPLFGLKRSATARAAVATGVTGYTSTDFQAWAGQIKLGR